MIIHKRITVDKHFEIQIRIDDGVKYRALVYTVDNTVKYIKPLTNETNESFFKHALQMIGWA